MPKTLGIIPARGGSKGVKHKNIRVVAGEPLIGWTLKAAKASLMLDHLLVSTDDDDIAAVARRYGGIVCLRPTHLAKDQTPMVPVVEQVLAEAEMAWGPMDYVCLLQPTSPQRTSDDIDRAITLLMSSGADSIVSVMLLEDLHPARSYVISAEGWLKPYNVQDARNYSDGLRQHLPAVYHRNGAIYACRAEVVREQHDLYGKRTLAYIMPKSRSLNIDDEFDLLVADLVMRHELANLPA